MKSVPPPLLMNAFGKNRWRASISFTAFFRALFVVFVATILLTTGSTPVLGQDAQTDQTELAVPDWVNKGSFSDGDKEFLLLKTEDFFLRSEASMVLMEKIRNAIDDQIDEVVGEGASRFVPLDDHYVQHEVVEEEVVIEKMTVAPATNREMRRYVGYARLCFDDDLIDRVRSEYQLNFKARRLQLTGLVGALSLCWLATAYGYLRLDNATRHFYSRRLQTLAIVSCLVPLIATIIVAVGWKLF